MLTFANPSLLPLLALLVPLAIHLWNRRPGREVAVGSVRWLTAGANRRLRNLRLEQVGLLALRLLLVAGVVGVLAGPVWHPRRQPGRGQVLVAPALAGTPALAAEHPRLDSLRRQGYGLRWLAPGLPAIGRAAWQADSLGAPADSILALDHLTAGPGWYAERVRLAADSLPGQPLLALTPATLRGNAGSRRPLPAGVTWRVLPVAGAARWLQSAVATPDSLYLTVGRGTEAQATFGPVRVARPRPGAPLAVAGLPALHPQLTAAGTGVVAPADSGQPAVPVRPASLRVAVVAAPADAADARPLRAALRAAALGLPGPLTLTVAATSPDTTQALDWLFWLTDAPVPAAWQHRVRRGLHLWQFGAGAGQPDTTHLARPLPAAPVAVWRRQGLAASARAEVLWQDGQGQPLLTREPLGRGATYRCATRLAPAWSELAASPALPALLLDVLHPAFDAAAQRQLAAHDPRRLDPTQVLPTGASLGARRPAPAFGPPRSLRPWLALLALALLGLERGLAARRAQPTTPSLT